MKKILGAILALGFVFRVSFLGQRQLWTDELMQALVIRAGSIDELIRNLRGGMPLPAPLDYVVQNALVLVLGDSPFSLRLHAAILGTLSIWLFYRVAVIMFGQRVALYAAALFAVYPLHHHYSQEARPYALLVALTLASWYLLLRCLSADGARSTWVAFAATLALMLYTSGLGIPVLISQAMALSLCITVGNAGGEPVTQRLRRALGDGPEPPGLRDLPRPGSGHALAFVAAALIALALYAPWVLSSWSAPHVVARAELARPGIVLVALKGIGDNSYPVTGLLLLGVVAGITALRAHGSRRLLLWLTSWPLAYIIAVWAMHTSLGYYFSARQLVPATPALILLAGYGFAHIGERLTVLDGFPYRLSSPAQVYAAVLLLMAVAVAQARWRNEPADWAGTAQYLEQNVRAGDSVSMPRIAPLVEYLAPSLRALRSADLDPGPGTLANGVARRFVVCYNGMAPDPCAGFRPGAAKDAAWTRRDLRGFTIFARDRK